MERNPPSTLLERKFSVPKDVKPLVFAEAMPPSMYLERKLSLQKEPADMYIDKQTRTPTVDVTHYVLRVMTKRLHASIACAHYKQCETYIANFENKRPNHFLMVENKHFSILLHLVVRQWCVVRFDPKHDSKKFALLINTSMEDT